MMQLHTGQRLTLYVAGASPQSSSAVRAVAALLRDAAGSYDLSVVDVYRTPSAAHAAGVVTVPSVVFTGGGSKEIVSGTFDEEILRRKLRII
jgi:hypothetical protein